MIFFLLLFYFDTTFPFVCSIFHMHIPLFVILLMPWPDVFDNCYLDPDYVGGEVVKSLLYGLLIYWSLVFLTYTQNPGVPELNCHVLRLPSPHLSAQRNTFSVQIESWLQVRRKLRRQTCHFQFPELFVRFFLRPLILSFPLLLLPYSLVLVPLHFPAFFLSSLLSSSFLSRLTNSLLLVLCISLLSFLLYSPSPFPSTSP